MAELSQAFVELLAQLHRGGQFGYWWTRSERMNTDGRAAHKQTYWFSTDPSKAIQLPADQMNRIGPIHIYFGVLPTNVSKGKHQRAEIKDIAALTCAFAEFDNKDFATPEACYEHVLSLDPTPSACLNSGGGYQCFWLLDQPFLLTTDADRAEAIKLLEAWVLLVGGDRQVKDLARVLRVPGTVNYKSKYGPDYPTAELLWSDTDITYTIQELHEYASPFMVDHTPNVPSDAPVQKSFSLTDDIIRAGDNLKRLSPSRRDIYNEWLSVGMALTPLGATGLALWDDWSGGSEKYVAGDCEHKWRGFTVDPHGLAKLGAWANDDDPQDKLPSFLVRPRTTTPKPAAGEPDDEAAIEAAECDVDADETTAAAVPELQLPPGYILRNNILHVTNRERVVPFFHGVLRIDTIGTDVISDLLTYTISWTSKFKSGRLTAPKRSLSTAQGVTEHGGGYNLPVHPGNAAAIASYLVELANHNEHIIPQVLEANRYGYVDSESHGDLLLLPGGTIGSAQPINYTGKSTVKIGSDPDAYPQMIRDLITWDAPIASLVLALSLAAPAVARIKPRRNPVLYLAGMSNIGKTSLLQFALGVWGAPYRTPFMVQAGGLSKVGAYQALGRQMGLPLCIDEAHMASDPALLESIAYTYANGETRTIGSLDGNGRGGEELHGTLFLTGEAMAEFRNAGSNNRTLWVDGNRYPPLGAKTTGKPGTHEHLLGEERSKALAQAVADGAGLFGKVYGDQLWADWPAFVQQVKAHQAAPSLQSLATWAPTLAIAFASLVTACDLVQATPPPPTLLDDWAALLMAGRANADPAERVFDILVSMMAAASLNEKNTDPKWEILMLENEPFAYRKLVMGVPVGEWRIPTTSKAMTMRMDPKAIEQVGQTWVARGWVLADPRTKRSTQVQRAGFPRTCLVVPPKMFDSWPAILRGDETPDDQDDDQDDSTETSEA